MYAKVDYIDGSRGTYSYDDYDINLMAGGNWLTIKSKTETCDFYIPREQIAQMIIRED
jgi:hypothetical protein